MAVDAVAWAVPPASQVAIPRQVAMFLCRELAKETFQALGAALRP
jgi:chromosomal replication initiation ATPase DnaA